MEDIMQNTRQRWTRSHADTFYFLTDTRDGGVVGCAKKKKIGQYQGRERNKKKGSLDRFHSR